ncbi:MAG: phosphatidate cytidylyltransferase [Parachlamydiales bacterium]|nr:phosphatidate cytidylyltransferase [Parachlamydiales bacterium]
MNELKRRIMTSAMAIVFLCIFIPFSTYPAFKPVFVAMIAALAAMGVWEFYQMAKLKGFQPMARTGVVFTVIFIFSTLVSSNYYDYTYLPSVVLGVAFLAFILKQFHGIESAIVNISTSVFGLLYVAVPMSCLVCITYFFLPEQYYDGRWWLVYLIVVTKMSDVGGFFIGKWIGSHKLAKKLSPKKTWEGSIGGIIFSVAASLILYYLAQSKPVSPLNITLIQALWLGVLIAIFGQVGDVAESLFKRDAKIKDSGHNLPGMGGVLDLLDAILFTAPLLLFFLKSGILG